ncbi:hypothetical protein DPEC_G00056440 [Dallia pectoralis]|uniref:Uncharacterized protein n=1 Tax=Dallia pectoralis TaxID=75939 RepID=A0ACC2H6W4_DALPE|nr:hypothetical protein DPEC_G00056440 [Dallia pectoralis]
MQLPMSTPSETGAATASVVSGINAEPSPPHPPHYRSNRKTRCRSASLGTAFQKGRLYREAACGQCHCSSCAISHSLFPLRQSPSLGSDCSHRDQQLRRPSAALRVAPKGARPQLEGCKFIVMNQTSRKEEGGQEPRAPSVEQYSPPRDFCGSECEIAAEAAGCWRPEKTLRFLASAVLSSIGQSTSKPTPHHGKHTCKVCRGAASHAHVFDSLPERRIPWRLRGCSAFRQQSAPHPNHAEENHHVKHLAVAGCGYILSQAAAAICLKSSQYQTISASR